VDAGRPDDEPSTGPAIGWTRPPRRADANVMARHLPVVCFWLSLVVGAAFVTLVAVAPRYAGADSPLALRFYAADPALRKVTLAAAAGLWATAFIFFRPAPLRFGRVTRADGAPPPTTDLAGA
jgi:hypothetical protein